MRKVWGTLVLVVATTACAGNGPVADRDPTPIGAKVETAHGIAGSSIEDTTSGDEESFLAENDLPESIGWGDTAEQGWLISNVPDLRLHLDGMLEGKRVPCWAGSRGEVIRCLGRRQWTDRLTHAEPTPRIALERGAEVQTSFTPGDGWESDGLERDCLLRWDEEPETGWEPGVLVVDPVPGRHELLIACRWHDPSESDVIGSGVGIGWLFDVTVQ